MTASQSRIKILLVIFASLSGSASLAQQVAYESPAGTKFLLYTPPGYASSTSTFPLLLSLHSKGEVGDDLSELTSKNPEQMPSRLIYLNRWPQDLPFIVLTPQLKPDPNDPEIQWSAEYIDEVVNHVTASFRVDLNRIYVTGISRGGTGTWTYASAYPEKIAAIIPLSGRSDLTQACAIKNIPVWAFHGDGDAVAPTEYSIDMVNAIKACQPRGIFTPNLNILHARNHNGWNEVYNGSSGYNIYEWLLMFRKNDASNKKPYVNAGPDVRIRLRNSPLHIAGDFFDADGSIANVTWRQTAGAALSLSNTGSEFLKINEPKTGSFEFELTVTDDKGLQNSDKVFLEITDDVASPAITELILINGKTNVDLGNLSEGQVIDKTALGLTEINVKAIASEGTASVRFSVNTDRNVRTQNSGPFLIKSQTTYPEWQIDTGIYLICATPYAKTYAGGDPGVSQCHKIVITDGPVSQPQPCEGTGKIEQEVWSDISGTLISSIPQNSEPSSTNEVTLFEGNANRGDNYGSRMRGFICPPTPGDYIFWISGNDRTELWLSPDENPANKKKIAYANGYTNVRQWTKYSSQQSLPVPLVANQRYYVEALHKEGVGSDHVAVGWQLPGGTLERPVPGIRLILFETPPTNPRPEVTITSPGDGETFFSPASVNIAATASVIGGSIVNVEFYNGSAKLGEDNTAPYTHTWSNVPGGRYSIMTKAIASTGTTATASIQISVTDSSSPCAGTGTILRELWTGISNVDIGSIPVDSPPDKIEELTIFEDLANVGDNYGTRLSGYICVPFTGPYTFWISSNDHGQLSISTNTDPANKKRIAYVMSATNPREWTKFATQKSVPVDLVAGQHYYMEALHKEGVGTDHMAVGWQLPNGVLERPIPGNRLSAATSQQTSIQSQEALTTLDTQSSGSDMMLMETHENALELFPNPYKSGDGDLSISLNGIVAGPGETTIEIMRATGEMIYSEKVFCDSRCNPYLVQVNDALTPGVWVVKIWSNGRSHSRKLLVR